MTATDGFVNFLPIRFSSTWICLVFYVGKFQKVRIRGWLGKTKNTTRAPQADKLQQMAEILEPGTITRFDEINNVITECSSSV